MRFTELIGSQTDYVEHQRVKPKYYPCPSCGQQGKRKRVLRRRVGHVAMLYRRSWVEAEVGVYQARCTCCKYFQAAIVGVPPEAAIPMRCEIRKWYRKFGQD